MDFDLLANAGWRETLIAVVVLLVFYIAFVFLRMRHLKRESDGASGALESPFKVASAVAAYTGTEKTVIASESGENTALGQLGTSEFQFPWNEAAVAPKVPQPDFQIEVLAVDVEQLRKEVGALRAEILLLKEALKRPPQPEPEPDVRRQPSLAEMIAPQYSEAMQLARKKMEPAEISQQCGISRAEAELVAALVKNRDTH